MLIVDNLPYFVLTAIVVYFMGKIAREDEGTVSYSLNHLIERRLGP